jgi:peptidoglycan/xylan/chitin deacetylase (PgdA/CDA1 family)
MSVDGAPATQFTMAPVVVIRGDGGPRIAGLGPGARRAPVVTPLPPATTAIDMPILVYHHVVPELPADPDQASISVTVDAFNEQLAELKDEGYDSVTAAELTNHLYYGLPLPEKPVMLTFDDGYDDALIHATHALDAYGMIGTFGIVSGFIGSPGYLTWDQVREMRDAGMEIISHSATHPGLGGVGPEQLADEIAGSKQAIETEAGVPVQALIYPYGEPFATGTLEEQQSVKAELHADGYALAITNPLPGAYPDIYQDGATPYELKRLMVSPSMSIERFAVRLTGAELQ